MLVIKTTRNYIDINTISRSAGLNPELISLRRSECDKVWRAWLSSEIKDQTRAEKDLLWAFVCDGCEAVILENGAKGWRRALR